MNNKYCFCIILLMLVSVAVQGQTVADSVNKILTAYAKKGQFDGSILIGKGSKVIFKHQYGLANRQFSVAITAATRFPVASVTKLYTAILILKLQERGKLNIDSTVECYIPGIIPKSGKQITIKQLLTHTSGLPREKVAAYQKRYNIKDFISKNVADTLLTRPGDRYQYNNVNYILLGAVIEAVTHQSWQQVLYTEIIEPLGLTNTGVVHRDSVISNLAYGYHNYAFGSLPARPLENDDLIYLDNYATAGAIFTTADELFKLHLALAGDKLLSPASKKLMYTPETGLGMVEHGDCFVALGCYIGSSALKGRSRKVDIIQRDGNINGYNATYIQLPATNEVVIILCNTDAGNLTKIANDILAALMPLH